MERHTRPRRAMDTLESGGRGLPLVEALSSHWGAWRLPHGVVVWAVLPAGPSGQAVPASLDGRGILPGPQDHVPTAHETNVKSERLVEKTFITLEGSFNDI